VLCFLAIFYAHTGSHEPLRIFIDESGSFSLSPSTGQLHLSCVVGVVISESSEHAIRRAYEKFLGTLEPGELKAGEPKGGRLSPIHRQQFCEDILVAHGGRGLLWAPIIVDDSTAPDDPGALRKKSHSRTFADLASGASNEEDKLKCLKIYEGIETLSDVQLRKIHTWALGVLESHRAAFRAFTTGDHDECWENFFIEIDSTDSHVDELQFRTMLPIWHSAYRRQSPFEVPDDFLDSDNPFTRKYIVEEDTPDWPAILTNQNIKFTDSKESWGIQVADICCNIVYRACRDTQTTSDAQKHFRLMMNACPYDPRGILRHVSSNHGLIDKLLIKYAHIMPPY
jgi:hypothetical protein